MFAFWRLRCCFSLIKFSVASLYSYFVQFWEQSGCPHCAKCRPFRSIALSMRFYKLRVDLTETRRAMFCSSSATWIFQPIWQAATYRNAEMLRKPNSSWRERVFAVCRRTNSRAWPSAQSTDTLGRFWRAPKSCQYPGHTGKIASVSGRHVINFKMVDEITVLFGKTTTAVGSRKRLSFCDFYWNFFPLSMFSIRLYTPNGRHQNIILLLFTFSLVFKVSRTE